jgi:hypothetical protein
MSDACSLPSSPHHLGRFDEEYVLGTNKTAHIEHYFRYANDNLRKKLEAGGITITDKAEWCWTEFNLKEIVEFKLT